MGIWNRFAAIELGIVIKADSPDLVGVKEDDVAREVDVDEVINGVIIFDCVVIGSLTCLW